MVPEALQHHRLACADFASQEDEALAALDTVNEIRKRFFMVRAPVKKCRIWTQVKRIANEAEKRLIHA